MPDGEEAYQGYIDLAHGGGKRNSFLPTLVGHRLFLVRPITQLAWSLLSRMLSISDSIFIDSSIVKKS